MMRLGDYGNDFDDWFRIRLSNFRHIGRPERIQILQDYKYYIDLILTDTRAKIEAVRRAHNMKPLEREDVLRVLEYQDRRFARELAWLAAMTNDQK
jgi:hypothetical protein